MRKEALVNGGIYHIYSKSIAEFMIFNNREEFLRFILSMRYYQQQNPTISFSKFFDSPKIKEFKISPNITFNNNLWVRIIAYCVMPTHIHFILNQLKNNGISIFMSRLLNSYARYFNLKHNRKGPLWESRFKNVLIKTQEQLLHLTRYIHLNPVTAYLVDRPEDWMASSYREYLSLIDGPSRICDYAGLFEIEPRSYRNFVNDRMSYQRELAAIRRSLLE